MEQQQNTNRTLMRGLDLLRAVGVTDTPTVTNLARLTGLAKSTTSRFLAVLVQEGYLSVDEKQRFRMAPKVLELGFSALQSLGVSEMVAGPLQDIADLCKGAANLGELDGTDVIMIARRTARSQKERFYSLNVHIGTRLPALYTATGRVLLGHNPTALKAALNRCENDRPSPTSIVDRTALAEIVQASKLRGVVHLRNELAPGFGAVAIAIPLTAQRTIALSGSYLLTDHDEDIESRVEAALRERVPEIAAVMNAHSGLPKSTHYNSVV